jgi:hypothetical protein
MKKLIALTLVSSLCFPTLVKSDETPKVPKLIYKKEKSPGEKCYDENTHIINLGIGAPTSGYYRVSYSGSYTYHRTPAIGLSYEQAYPKRLGPGYLGVGAYFGYQGVYYKNSYYNYNNGNGNGYQIYDYSYRWNYFSLGARGAYHWDVLNAKNAEVYAGVIIGLRFQTYSYTNSDPDPYYHNLYDLHQNSVFPSYGVFAGARWWFVKNVGLYAEAGYGISYFTGGFSFKF